MMQSTLIIENDLESGNLENLQGCRREHLDLKSSYLSLLAEEEFRAARRFQ
jgi:hypothetical protein